MGANLGEYMTVVRINSSVFVILTVILTVVLVYVMIVHNTILDVIEKKRLSKLNFEDIYKEKERSKGTHTGIRLTEEGKILVTTWEDVRIDSMIEVEVVEDEEKAGTYEKITYSIEDEQVRETKEQDTVEGYTIYVG